jgi:hypothetical protein
MILYSHEILQAEALADMLLVYKAINIHLKKHYGYI